VAANDTYGSFAVDVGVDEEWNTSIKSGLYGTSQRFANLSTKLTTYDGATINKSTIDLDPSTAGIQQTVNLLYGDVVGSR
jgi:hypothetical protein